jgi:hypothetical protein
VSVRGTYVAALLGWAAGGLVGPVAAVVLLYLGAGSGLGGFVLMLLVVAFGVPTVVAWRLRSHN